MPIPKRGKEEDRNKFMSRCMSDTNMKEDYKEGNQRVAVCLNQATDGMDLIQKADFEKQVKEYGYAEELDENNFYVPAEAEYEDFGEPEEEWDISIAKPGLWENIRRKKEREGKNYRPARTEKEGRPTQEQLKRAQSEPSEKQKKALDKNKDGKISKEDFELLRKGKSSYKYEDPKTGQVFTYTRRGNYKNGDTPLIYKGEAAEYQGRKVKLGKPFLTPDGPKKRSVYVKNDKGNVVKVNFGDPNMKIKKSDPGRRKNFRARHNCDNPGPRWKARYWSCKAW